MLVSTILEKDSLSTSLLEYAFGVSVDGAVHTFKRSYCESRIAMFMERERRK